MQLRTLKGLHRFYNFDCKFEDIPCMWVYVYRAELANRNNPTWARLADKYAVRSYIEQTIGSRYLIPLLGEWENPGDIDFDALEAPFVLKTNNGCGTNIFVHDKSTLDRKGAVESLRKTLTFPYPELTAQHHYALIPPRVIAEKLMVEKGSSHSLTDYKIHCVNGEPVRIYVFKDRDEISHFDFKVMAFDKEWKEYPEAITESFRTAPGAIGRPEQLQELLECARRLSADEEYVRVDFYIIDGQIYFGELTFTPDTAAHAAYPVDGMNPILDRIKADRRAGKSKRIF